jgi:hypothetical protein
MERYFKNNTFSFIFDGIREYGQFINKIANRSGYAVTSEDDFFGGTFDQAIKESQAGSVARVVKFRQHIDALKMAINANRRTLKPDMAGPVLDVPAYLAGLPECFRRFEPKPEAPAVNIQVDLGLGGYVGADEIYNRAAAIVALIDGLQAAGRRVNLTIEHLICGSIRRQYIYRKINIKLDPIDLSELAFALSPLCKRRFGFVLYEQFISPDGDRNRYGINEILKAPEGPAIVFVGSRSKYYQDENYTTPEAAAAHVENMLAQFNAGGPDEIVKG